MRAAWHGASRARRVLAACAVTTIAAIVPIAAGASSPSVPGARIDPAASGATVPASNGAIAFMRFATAREDDHSPQIFVRSPNGSVRQLTHFTGGAFIPHGRQMGRGSHSSAGSRASTRPTSSTR